MTTSGAIELFRNAIIVAAQIAGPALIAALIVGIVIGILQTATQINEPSLSFLLKLAAIVVAFAAVGPYAVTRMVEYTRTCVGSISEVVR
jgi:flagellar biosynthesis protein FliQ